MTDEPPVQDVSTETFRIIVQTPDVSSHRQVYVRIAEICEVRIDRIKERRRFLATELAITVTGTPQHVEEFWDATFPAGPGSGDPVDWLFGESFDRFIAKRLRRRRARRAR